MGTGLAVTNVFSCLNFSRVVLDFLFHCHILEMSFEMGDAPRSFNGLVRPLFSFSPKQRKTLRSSAHHKKGRDLILRKTGAGSKQGCQGGGVQSQRETRLRSHSRLT
jgi:hypothetical protein